MVKNINIIGKLNSKLTASLLIITIFILNYCSICFLYWNNDYKILMNTLKVNLYYSQLETKYYFVYQSMKDDDHIKEAKIDNELVVVERYSKIDKHKVKCFLKNKKYQTLCYKYYY